jgi:hypothetical protein
MDWLASDVLPQTSTLEQEHQPLHQNLHTPLSNPAPSTSQSTPAQWDISSQPQPLLQLIPTPSSTPGLHSSQSTPGQWGTSSLPQPQPSAFGDLTIQQSEEDRSAPTDVPQPRMPPLVPTAERSGSGRYGLRTRSVSTYSHGCPDSICYELSILVCHPSCRRWIVPAYLEDATVGDHNSQRQRIPRSDDSYATLRADDEGVRLEQHNLPSTPGSCGPIVHLELLVIKIYIHYMYYIIY